jgi:hypothetical protein
MAAHVTFVRSAVFASAMLAAAPALAGKECVETSDTLGETTCRRYGDGWAIERESPITYRFGFRYGEFRPAGVRFNDNTKRSQRTAGYRGYFVPGERFGVSTLSGFGTDGGVSLILVDQLYVGAELAILVGGAHTATFTVDDYTLRDGGKGIDVLLIHAGAPIGYRIPLGRASIRGEVLAGGIVATVSHKMSGPSAPPEEASVGARWLIEPRIAGDIWFTQHIAFGAYAGVNVLDSNARAFGVSLAFHSRAFDGDRSLW